MRSVHARHRAGRRFTVLHGLRIKGRAAAGELAAWSRWPEPDVEGELNRLAGTGDVMELASPLAGWVLTDAGRSCHERELEAELAGDHCAPCRGRLATEFDRFLALNDDVLEAVSAWQVRPFGSAEVPNDHSEPAYDAGILRRIDAVQRRVAPVLRSAADVLERLAPYEPRLDAALDRCRRGDHAWLASPRVGSYHTVWFELHEDLLLSLGRSRAEPI